MVRPQVTTPNEQYFWSLVGQRYEKITDVRVKQYIVKRFKPREKPLDNFTCSTNIAPPLTSDLP